ncbi:MarR family winged helix-turn-helix transcriptional regulator [Devosia faecipullorum]|uniref:MarR family winged helix-turn-helix transcriptional regulator n=1 Tax=Devosia faecipullorum TaxID=2755039 RepID=UPI00187B753A|nr:MarR family transcriptional regulator [Devosia faecipullorum]MBE7732858.1 MarR family transcriptional regulator [Devosia faecipullorum]
MADLLIPTPPLANLLEQVARRLHAQAHALDLFPAQWAALRYIARMPLELRTSSDLARFQGQEHSAVARTVRTLVLKGYLQPAGRAGRGRATALELTPQGEALLRQDPLLKLRTVFERYDGPEREIIARFLEDTVRILHDDEPR